MAVISVCWRDYNIAADKSDTKWYFLETSDTNTVISAKKMHCHCINDTGREKVNTKDNQGIKCAPGKSFPTVRRVDALDEKRDLCFSLA